VKWAYGLLIQTLPALSTHLHCEQFDQMLLSTHQRLHNEIGKGLFNYLDMMWDIFKQLRHKNNKLDDELAFSLNKPLAAIIADAYAGILTTDSIYPAGITQPPIFNGANK